MTGPAASASPRTLRRDAAENRARLLRAACEVFAEHGKNAKSLAAAARDEDSVARLTALSILADLVLIPTRNVLHDSPRL